MTEEQQSGDSGHVDSWPAYFTWAMSAGLTVLAVICGLFAYLTGTKSGWFALWIICAGSCGYPGIAFAFVAVGKQFREAIAHLSSLDLTHPKAC